MATSFSGGGSQSTRTTTDHREASGTLYHYRVYGIKYKIFHEKCTTCFPMVGGCPGTLASSTTKTGRHDIAEILLKVALKHQK
jgi:hypothetical protein